MVSKIASKGKRGRVLPPEPETEGKVRITIRQYLDGKARRSDICGPTRDCASSA